MISMAGVVKRFGSTTALDGLDLTVEEGEVLGFLGPNGAGKTTTLRVLLGLLRIESGDVSVLGMDPWRDAVALHRRLAYVPGDVSLWPNLTGGEVIDLLGRLRGGLNQQRRADLIEMFDLDPTKKTRAYSKGNRQKVALISALASDVELLLLDEPTAGLDPLMESMFRGVINDWRGDGRSVLLSSHILSEAEALSDRLSIIRDGRVVETGTLAQLRHLLRTSVSAVLSQRAGRPDVDPGRARRGRRRRDGDVPGRSRGPRRSPPRAHRRRRRVPHHRTAVPRAGLPPALRKDVTWTGSSAPGR